MRHFLSLILLFSSCAMAGDLSGRIVSVLDGDTVILLDAKRTQHRIRLAEIDAPEKAMDYGQRAKKHLSDLAYGKQATAKCPQTDQYGRSVCRLYVGGLDANLTMVKDGMAWCYRRYAKDPAILAAESSARAASRGLWAMPSPVPPWEWRHQSKTNR